MSSLKQHFRSEEPRFVLLGQGRHVLDNSFYRDIVIQKLETDEVQVGPVLVLYIKEGYAQFRHDWETLKCAFWRTSMFLQFSFNIDVRRKLGVRIDGNRTR